MSTDFCLFFRLSLAFIWAILRPCLMNIHTFFFHLMCFFLFVCCCIFFAISCFRQLLNTTNHLSIPLCYWRVYSMVSGVWLWPNNVPTDLPFFYLLSLRDLMRHWHTCKPSPAGLLLMSRPPCESTLSLSLPIILEHYWLLMCLSTRPQISNVIIKRTNNPLFSSPVITGSNTPLV